MCEQQFGSSNKVKQRNNEIMRIRSFGLSWFTFSFGVMSYIRRRFGYTLQKLLNESKIFVKNNCDSNQDQDFII